MKQNTKQTTYMNPVSPRFGAFGSFLVLPAPLPFLAVAAATYGVVVDVGDDIKPKNESERKNNQKQKQNQRHK